MVLTVDQLSLTVKNFTILNAVDLTLDNGEILCVAGRNGAGKTSLLKCISGLENRYTGTLKYSEELGTDRIKDNVGIMIDGISVYSYLSGEENLDIIRRYYGLPFSAVNETLQLVGLKDSAKKKVKYYSAGMKQRLAIAMAFIHRPSLVILDEPLNALDPEAIVEIRNLINKMNQEFFTTFIISSHSLEEIGKLFTRLIIVKSGTVVLNVTRDEVQRFQMFKGQAKENSAIAQSLHAQPNLIHRMDKDGTIQIATSNQELIRSVLSEDSGVEWQQPEKINLEDIYLFANSK
ncbi:hypothetical protein BH09BAC3_BH09BAC3_38120 [soil metagenome]